MTPCCAGLPHAGGLRLGGLTRGPGAVCKLLRKTHGGTRVPGVRLVSAAAGCVTVLSPARGRWDPEVCQHGTGQQSHLGEMSLTQGCCSPAGGTMARAVGREVCDILARSGGHTLRCGKVRTQGTGRAGPRPGCCQSHTRDFECCPQHPGKPLGPVNGGRGHDQSSTLQAPGRWASGLERKQGCCSAGRCRWPGLGRGSWVPRGGQVTPPDPGSVWEEEGDVEERAEEAKDGDGDAHPAGICCCSNCRQACLQNLGPWVQRL